MAAAASAAVDDVDNVRQTGHRVPEVAKEREAIAEGDDASGGQLHHQVLQVVLTVGGGDVTDSRRIWWLLFSCKEVR